MKTKLIIFFIFFASLQVSGQHFGLKAGATFATLRGDDAENFEHRVGYTFGGMYQHHFTQKVGIQTELLYTSKGAINEYRTDGNTVEDKYRLNYLDLPVMLHLTTGRVFVDLGPQISFMAKARRITDVEPDGGNSTTTVKTNITDNPYALDYSLVAGIGYRAVNNIGIEARYGYGLKKLDDEGNAVGLDRYNSTIYLMVSYLFIK